MSSNNGSQLLLLTEDASTAVTADPSVTMIAPVEAPVTTAGKYSLTRVQDVRALQPLLMNLSHNAWLQQYAMNHFREPDTLILTYGRSCIIASIVRHDLMQDTAIIVWAQNPDGFNAYTTLKLVKAWAKDRDCKHIAAYIDMDSKLWKHMRAARRLTKMGPYKIVVSTGVGV